MVSGRVDNGSTRARVKKKVLKGSNSIPKEHHQITLPLQLDETNGNCELPWDVLNIISKTLDFDNHFQFAAVCKNWRAFHKIYWTNFLASQQPLLVQLSFHNKGSFCFVTIPAQKVYCSTMANFLFHSVFVTSSSGYFIMASSNNSFSLIDPFTRIKKVTNICTFEYCDIHFASDKHALLAFDKCSEEFVLVFLCKRRLYVYQSRNCGWVSYSTMKNGEEVTDFVVLHNIIYVVTNKVNIGVLSLNSANIKFIKLKSTPRLRWRLELKLVNCDEQLLLVEICGDLVLKVYKIDFSTMDYVELKTLGDIALFYTVNGHCYASSNPSRWGYESNSVYVMASFYPECRVYSGDDSELHRKLQKYITIPVPLGIRTFPADWYFRHIKYEIDYSLVE
ncbi:unnamed protein product [Trifolium pratense]|uniref:Uncharacterized protein n=1 Tax=Trifolium pratense TaxID=57577 RepID=A0ACB0IEY5_TRIPR|nr:unnamed protein product [Trifolium pratense]